MALDQGRPQSGRGDVQLLGQLREGGQSERAGLPAWPVFTNADNKVLYIGDPITVEGVANFNSLKVFDSVYTMVHGKPFAETATASHKGTH